MTMTLITSQQEDSNMTEKQITVNVSLLQKLATCTSLPPAILAEVQHELSQKENVGRELRRLLMRLDTLTPSPKQWPSNIEQVSSAFSNKTGKELFKAVAYSLRWLSSTTWITNSAQVLLDDLANLDDAQFDSLKLLPASLSDDILPRDDSRSSLCHYT